MFEQFPYEKLRDADGVWHLQPDAPFSYEVRWAESLDTNSDAMDAIVLECAESVDEVHRQLIDSVASRRRFYRQSDVDRFADQYPRKEDRLRAVLKDYANRSTNHNRGALYISLHRSGHGVVADRVLATKIMPAPASPAALLSPWSGGSVEKFVFESVASRSLVGIAAVVLVAVCYAYRYYPKGTFSYSY